MLKMHTYNAEIPYLGEVTYQRKMSPGASILTFLIIVGIAVLLIYSISSKKKGVDAFKGQGRGGKKGKCAKCPPQPVILRTNP